MRDEIVNDLFSIINHFSSHLSFSSSSISLSFSYIFCVDIFLIEYIIRVILCPFISYSSLFNINQQPTPNEEEENDDDGKFLSCDCDM